MSDVSNEAIEAVNNLRISLDSSRQHNKRVIQQAIDAATAEKDAEIERLKRLAKLQDNGLFEVSKERDSLRRQVERMRGVVEAAKEWRRLFGVSAAYSGETRRLIEAIGDLQSPPAEGKADPEVQAVRISDCRSKATDVMFTPITIEQVRAIAREEVNAGLERLAKECDEHPYFEHKVAGAARRAAEGASNG